MWCIINHLQLWGRITPLHRRVWPRFYFASVIKVKINKCGCIKPNASFMWNSHLKIARRDAPVSKVLLEYLVKRTYWTFIESLVIFLVMLPLTFKSSFDRCYLAEPWKRKLSPKVAKPRKNCQAALRNDFPKTHSKLFRCKRTRIQIEIGLSVIVILTQFFFNPPSIMRFYFKNNLHINSRTI